MIGFARNLLARLHEKGLKNIRQDEEKELANYCYPCKVLIGLVNIWAQGESHRLRHFRSCFISSKI